jgi:hypothetical protein
MSCASVSRQGPMTGFCERSKKPSGFMRVDGGGGGVIVYLSDYNRVEK